MLLKTVYSNKYVWHDSTTIVEKQSNHDDFLFLWRNTGGNNR